VPGHWRESRSGPVEAWGLLGCTCWASRSANEATCRNSHPPQAYLPSAWKELLAMALDVQVTFDATDPQRLSEFWALALDYEVWNPHDGREPWEVFGVDLGPSRTHRDTWSAVVDPEGRGPRVLFRKVAESKTTEGRVHLNVDVSGHGKGTEGW